MKSKELKIYLIAGEPSGDLLGSRIMRALKKKTNRAVRFFGVGGETMEKEGLKSLFDIADLAVMGFVEVLPNLPKILRHFNEIIADIQAVQPDVILTVDSFSFSVRVHKRLIKAGIQIPHAHCVAPQVWAWKKGRAKTLGQYVDRLFCLLPKEPAYFTPYGLKADFIGHPVIEGGADKGNKEKFIKRYHIPKEAKILCVLPGSRQNEIKYLLPVFQEAIHLIRQKYQNVFVVIPTVSTVWRRVVQAMRAADYPYVIVQGEKERYDAFAAADVAVAASGTVSLELALAGVKHLIAYRVSPFTAFLARRLLKIKYVNLINLLANKELIPELLQENCTATKIADVTIDFLRGKKQNAREGLEKLGWGGQTTPSEKAAELLLKMVAEHD